MSESVIVRAAVPEDAGNIHSLLMHYAEKKLLLPRTEEDILEKIGNFRVGEVNGKFIGCCALRDFGGDLFEVRSLAVDEQCNGRGYGSQLVRSILDQLQKAGRSCRIFSLTYRADFFCRLGFHVVQKDLFPQKIWSDCILCPKREKCDETAVLLEMNV